MNYTIYQSKNPTFTVKKDKYYYLMDDYNKVYEGEIDKATPNTMADRLFTKFNVNRPSDFKGHSLSVGDIIEFRSGVEKFYLICDMIGWKPVDLSK